MSGEMKQIYLHNSQRYIFYLLYYTTMKKFILIALLLSSTLFLAGCSDADVASRNLSTDADYFKIFRRVVFYNWINSEYILSIEWFCSLGNNDPTDKLTVTCKTWPDEYKKHFLGLSDNVTYFVEQLEWKKVSVDHYKVIFKPSTIIPDIDIKM